MSTRTTPLGRHLVGALTLVVVIALVAVDARAGADEGSPTQGRGDAAATGPTGAPGAVAAGDPASSLPADASGHHAYADLPAVEPSDSVPADEEAQDRAGVGAGGGPRVHIVASGETPSEIAATHGVPTSALVRANAHVEATTLQPGDTLVVPDPDVARPLTPQEAPTERPNLQRLLVETARAYGWNPATVQAVAWVESRWDQHVVSHRGAIGVMQVQPATGEVVSRRIGRQLDLHDVEDNVEAGVAYLDMLHERYGSDTRGLLAAYHQGPRAVRERGIYRVSHLYADRILHLREVFPRGEAGG